MSIMTNPMDALEQLQVALICRAVEVHTCDIHKDISVIVDKPNGTPRHTYFKKFGEKAQAISLFVLVDPIEGLPCFQMGWATLKPMRKRGLAKYIVEKSIEEMKNGLNRNGITEFYIEAVISDKNTASIKIAENLFSTSSKKCIDEYSGQSALQFLRKVE